MGVHQELQLLRSQTLEKVRIAAHEGHADDVLTQGRKLSQIEELLRQYEALSESVRNLSQDRINGGPPKDSPTRAGSRTASGLTPRQRGRQRRRELVDFLDERGIRLSPFQGAIRKSSSGLRVGTAYASERRPDRWFLGLPEDEFEHAILICEDDASQVHYLSVSQRLMSEHGRAMSRSQGQIKFNVSRRDGDFFLVVPGVEPVRLPLVSQELNLLT